jgi:hypothetical protein
MATNKKSLEEQLRIAVRKEGADTTWKKGQRGRKNSEQG